VSAEPDALPPSLRHALEQQLIMAKVRDAVREIVDQSEPLDPEGRTRLAGILDGGA